MVKFMFKFVDKLMCVSICLLLVLFSGTVFAGDEKTAGPGLMKRLRAELNLSDEQNFKLNQMKSSGQWSTRAKREAMEKALVDFEIIIGSQAKDEEVKLKYEDLQKRQEEYGRARLEKILVIRSILTPAQRAQFKNYFDRK